MWTQATGKTVFAMATLAAAILFTQSATAQRYLGKSPTPPTRQGVIEQIRTSEGKTIFRVRIDDPDHGGITAVGGEPIAVRRGMKVRLDIRLGTAFFRIPIGVVRSVDADGRGCLAVLRVGSLDRSVQNPSDQSLHPAAEFFHQGAAVVLSWEPG
jgi:hypothetical protein